MSIRFNGADIPSFVKVKSIEVGVLPPISQTTLQVPGRPGIYDLGDEIAARKITVEYVIIADSSVDLRAKVREFAQWLRVDSAKQLIILDEPDKYYLAKPTGEMGLEETLNIGKGSLEFICSDPYVYGTQEFTHIIAGMPKATEDTDSQSEWASGTLTNTLATSSGLQLGYQGTDYTGTETDWAQGTHTNTVKSPNGNKLVLGSTYTTTNQTYTNDYRTGTYNDTAASGTELILTNRPTWEYTDDMDNYLGTGWIEFFDNADPGTASIATVTTPSGHGVQVIGNDKDVAIRKDLSAAFPYTFEFVYKLGKPAGSTNTTDTVGILARFIDPATNTNGKHDLYSFLLTDTAGQWKWARVVIRSARKADLYINGVFDRTLDPVDSSLTPRVQFFIDTALYQGDFTLSYFAMAPGALLPSPVSSYEFPYSGDHVSVEYNLSSLGTYQNGTVNFTSVVPQGVEGFNHSAKLEIDVFKNGSWQGYTQIANGAAIPYLTAGDSLNGVKVRLKTTLSAYTSTAAVKMSNSSVTVNGQVLTYLTSGNRVSVGDPGIQVATKARRATITWEDNVPAGTTVRAFVALETDGVMGQYEEVTKGGDIPQIDATVDLTTSKLYTKFELTTSNNNVTPEVLSCSYTFYSAYHTQGERIGQGIPLDVAETVGSTLITWDGTPDDSPDIEVYVQKVNSGSQPTEGGWVRVNTNGGSIPVIANGENVVGKTLYSKQILRSNGVSTPTLNELYWEVQKTGGGTFTYNGTEKTYPLVTVDITQNVATSLEILHRETGNRLILNRAFNVGDQIIIDNETGRVTVNGVVDLTTLSMYSDFFYLVEGVNTFETTPADISTITVTWKERFI